MQPSQVTVGAGSGVEADTAAADGGVDDSLLSPLKTSKRITRYRCKDCGCPVLAKIGGSMLAIPFSSVEWGASGIDQSWAPKHHMYYSDRVMDVDDELPKYDRSFQQGQREQAKAPPPEGTKEAAGAGGDT